MWRGPWIRRHNKSCNSIKTSSIHRRNWELPKRYTRETLQALPSVCTEGSQIWRARTLLAIFEIIEMHLPDLVLCQFGLREHIPDAFEQVTQINRASKAACDWRQEFSTYIRRWDNQSNEVQSHRYPPQYPQTTWASIWGTLIARLFCVLLRQTDTNL